ncbi:DNA glycosylase AlkZ-like family protein [Kocuria flava]|uniref:DNA glycosylase AlkZ-like family protein n=1 Tax=Kocuria flava TaxID=446860 RepID=UPI002F929FCF
MTAGDAVDAGGAVGPVEPDPPVLTDREIGLARLLAHGLAEPGELSPDEVVRRLGAVQAQDLPGALVSVGLRRSDGSAGVREAFDDARIVRTWPMRGTLHLVPGEELRAWLAVLGPRTEASTAARRRELGIAERLEPAREAALGALQHGPQPRERLHAAWEEAGLLGVPGLTYHLMLALHLDATLCFGPLTGDGRDQLVVPVEQWLPPGGNTPVPEETAGAPGPAGTIPAPDQGAVETASAGAPGATGTLSAEKPGAGGTSSAAGPDAVGTGPARERGAGGTSSAAGPDAAGRSTTGAVPAGTPAAAEVPPVVVRWVRRYLRSHGPVAVEEAARWAALPRATVRAAAAVIDDVVAVRDRRGRLLWCAPEVLAALPGSTRRASRVLLLPPFDEFVLGYGDRAHVLAPAHARRIVPGGNGVFRPTVVAGGRIAGTWSRRRRATGDELLLEPFGTLSETRRRAAQRAFGRLPVPPPLRHDGHSDGAGIDQGSTVRGSSHGPPLG